MKVVIEANKKYGGKSDFKVMDEIAEKLEKACLLKPLAISNQVRHQPQAVKSCYDFPGAIDVLKPLIKNFGYSAEKEARFFDRFKKWIKRGGTNI